MMSYLSCPLCNQFMLSTFPDLLTKIVSALTRSINCPVCNIPVQGLKLFYCHLSNHLSLLSNVQESGSSNVPEQIPSLESLEINDLRDEIIPNNQNCNSENNPVERPNLTPPNCGLCGLVFSSQYFLTLHTEIMHPDTTNVNVECKPCNTRFNDLQTYQDHVKRMHSERKYICDLCPKSFKIKGGLLMHSRMAHDNSSPVSCTICNKTYKNPSRKALHERRCHGLNSDVKYPLPKSTLSRKSNNNVANLSPNISFKEIDPINSREIKIPINEKQTQIEFKILQPQVEASKLPHEAHNYNFHINSATPDDAFNERQINKMVEEMSSTAIPAISDIDTDNILTNLFNDNLNEARSNNSELNSTIKIGCMDTKFLSDIQLPSCSNSHSDRVSNIQCTNTKTGFQPELEEHGNKMSTPNHRIQSTGIETDIIALPLLQESDCKSSQDHRISSANINSLNLSILEENNYKNVILDHQTQIYLSNDSSMVEHKQDLTIQANNNFDNKIMTPTTCHPKNVNIPDDGMNSQESEDRINSSFQSQIKNVSNVDSLAKPSNESKPWECDECKKSFTTKYFLKKHKRLHTGEQPYTCEECGKNFAFQQSYHKHIFYHKDEKPHTCSYCQRAFKELSTLHNHIRIHTGERPFGCATCGKKFRQRVSYIVHQRIHTGILPYRCVACGKAFRYKVSLRSHKCEVNLGPENSGEAQNVPEHSALSYQEITPETMSEPGTNLIELINT